MSNTEYHEGTLTPIKIPDQFNNSWEDQVKFLSEHMDYNFKEINAKYKEYSVELSGCYYYNKQWYTVNLKTSVDDDEGICNISKTNGEKLQFQLLFHNGSDDLDSALNTGMENLYNKTKEK